MSQQPVNVRTDINLSDQDLILISTKGLNKLLKDKKVDKKRQKEIKAERRTLKNRGYAANCRKKREEEEAELLTEIEELDRLIMQEEDVRSIRYPNTKMCSKEIYDISVLQFILREGYDRLSRRKKELLQEEEREAEERKRAGPAFPTEGKTKRRQL